MGTLIGQTELSQEATALMLRLLAPRPRAGRRAASASPSEGRTCGRDHLARAVRWLWTVLQRGRGARGGEGANAADAAWASLQRLVEACVNMAPEVELLTLGTLAIVAACLNDRPSYQRLLLARFASCEPGTQWLDADRATVARLLVANARAAVEPLQPTARSGRSLLQLQLWMLEHSAIPRRASLPQ